MGNLIHADFYKPRIFPILGDVDDAEIDRAQGIDPTVGLNREKIEEIGREGVVGYLKKSPTVGYRLTQLEYGNIEFWQKLVNNEGKGDVAEDAITISDFKNAYFDIAGYMTDDAGAFNGTIYYPALRTAGFSITIGDPQANIERSFDLVGEGARQLQGDNKYFIYNKHTAGSGGDNVIDLSAKAPAVDPDNAGVFMFRVVRVRGSVSTELVRTTDYSYSDGSKELTVVSIQSGDIIKSWYSSAIAPDVQFTPNDVDVEAVAGDSVSIYLFVPGSGKPSSADYVYRLQSVTLDVRFDREDQREIGNKNVVQRGISNTTVSVTLGRILEGHTVEEILRGVDPGYGIIDVEKLTDQASLVIKVFDDNTKTNFKYGFRADGLSATEMKPAVGVNEYVKRDNTLEGEDLSITADTSILGI